MKIRGLLKWEAIATARHVRWVVVPALVLWVVLMAVTFLPFDIGAWGIARFLDMPLVVAGAYVGMICSVIGVDGYVKKSRLAERLTDLPPYVFFLVKSFINIFLAGMGIGFLFLASLLHRRVGTDRVDIFQELTGTGHAGQCYECYGCVYAPAYFMVLFILFMLIFIMPSWGYAWDAMVNAGVNAGAKRWRIRFFWVIYNPLTMVLGMSFIINFLPDYDFFQGAWGLMETAAIGVGVLAVVANVVIGHWLYDTVVDVPMT